MSKRPDITAAERALEIAWGELHLVKGGTNPHRKEITGIASTEHADLDGETLVQKGLEWAEKVPLTLEHPRGVLNLIGEVTELKLGEHEGKPCTFFKAVIFTNIEWGKKVYDRAVELTKAESSIKLGVSVEGGATERDPANPKVILKAKIAGLAVTLAPRNTAALWDPIMASLFGAIGDVVQGQAITDGGLGTLVPQSIAGKLVSVEPKGAALLRTLKELGITGTDIAVAVLAKRMPHLSWAVAEAAYLSKTEGGLA